MNKNNEIKVLHLFPHIGTIVPHEARLKSEHRKDVVQDTIEVNRDTGLDEVCQYLVDRNNKDESILKFDYARCILDANRLRAEDQVPEHVYKGHDLIDLAKTSRIELIEKYIDPWFAYILNVCTQNPDMKVVHWHSMDVYGGGKHNLVKDMAAKRPIGTVITRFDCNAEPIIKYCPESKRGIIYEDQMLSDSFAMSCCDIFNKEFFKNNMNAQEAFSLNNPYKVFGTNSEGKRILGPSLPNIIARKLRASNRSQLVLEFRKDLPAITHNFVAKAVAGVDKTLEMMQVEI